MRCVRASAAVAVFVGLLLTAALTQAAPVRSLKGQLVFETPGVSRNPCRVSLMRPTGQPIGITIADSAGNFTFDNVEPGSYTIRVEIDGFDKIDQDFDFADSFGGATATVLIAPRRIGPAVTGEGGGKIDVSEYQAAYPKKAVEFFKKGMENKKKEERPGHKALRAGDEKSRTEFLCRSQRARHGLQGRGSQGRRRKGISEGTRPESNPMPNRSSILPACTLTRMILAAQSSTGEQAVKANSRSAPAFFDAGTRAL